MTSALGLWTGAPYPPPSASVHQRVRTDADGDGQGYEGLFIGKGAGPSRDGLSGTGTGASSYPLSSLSRRASLAALLHESHAVLLFGQKLIMVCAHD